MDNTSDAAKAYRSLATIKARIPFWRRSNQSRSMVIWIAINSRSCFRLALRETRWIVRSGTWKRNAPANGLGNLEGKRSGKRAWELANIPRADQVEASFTISLDTPAKMAAAAAAANELPILKLKLYIDDSDLARVQAVRAAAPNARLVIDAN